MHIVFRSYLDRIGAEERAKPLGQRRRVPSIAELAAEVGMHPVTLSKIANGNIRQLSLDTGGKIITAVRRYGFPMETTDLVVYLPEDSAPPA